MPAFRSNQETRRTAAAYKPLKANESRGRVRIAYFDWTTVAGLAIADTLDLVQLPDAARVLAGRIAFGALGAGATVDIGVAGAQARYLAAGAVAAAGTLDFANTTASNIGDELAADTVIFATITGAAWAAGQVIRGWIMYAQND